MPSPLTQIKAPTLSFRESPTEGQLELDREEEMAKFERNIVIIDEEKCDGCGDCVPSCAEGAIQIIDGKARLVADNLCDGLGNCLGTCPQGAITVEPREAESFDEKAVEAHLDAASAASSPARGSSAADRHLRL